MTSPFCVVTDQPPPAWRAQPVTGERVKTFAPSAIAARVKGKAIIFADGGVRSGADVLKLLALGADAVLVGRPMVVAAFGGGREGVALMLNQLKNELLQAMLLTGTADVKQVSASILHREDR